MCGPFTYLTVKKFVLKSTVHIWAGKMYQRQYFLKLVYKQSLINPEICIIVKIYFIQLVYQKFFAKQSLSNPEIMY